MPLTIEAQPDRSEIAQALAMITVGDIKLLLHSECRVVIERHSQNSELTIQNQCHVFYDRWRSVFVLKILSDAFTAVT